ncbi:MAG: methyltransferase C-terminal domain-containing protein [Actinomycetes bacterium]
MVYGGALRVHMRCATAQPVGGSESVERVLAIERLAGLGGLQAYRAFAKAVVAARSTTVATAPDRAQAGRPMLGYGAPARAVTLLNYYALDTSTVPATADASSVKQGRYLPGVRIPIVSLEELRTRRPADVLILVWGHRDRDHPPARGRRHPGRAILGPDPAASPCPCQPPRTLTPGRPGPRCRHGGAIYASADRHRSRLEGVPSHDAASSVARITSCG